MTMLERYQPKTPIRVVTSTSLFDGHDAAINIMRRVLQDNGAEVIHLGHNRSVKEIVNAAIQEDAKAIAISSYQGGHVEFFRYTMQLLKEANAEHIQVFGGGGGVIVPQEIKEIEGFGVSKIYSPEDGREHGLVGIIQHLLKSVDKPWIGLSKDKFSLTPEDHLNLAKCITGIELQDKAALSVIEDLIQKSQVKAPPVLGVTGTGGAGKSSLVDELLTRFMTDFPEKKVAVISVDPSRSKTQGALLGDRIRMNSLKNTNIYMRSLATREQGNEITKALPEIIRLVKAVGFDFVIVETAGIGQGDAGIAALVDKSLYVMNTGFGAATQLEKIEMLDYADWVAINKFDHQGAEDALRDVRTQYRRNHKLFDTALEEMPVYGTIASRFYDDGVTALYFAIIETLSNNTWQSSLTKPDTTASTKASAVIPGKRIRYLAEIAEGIREYHQHVETQATIAEDIWRLEGALNYLDDKEGVTTQIKALEKKLNQEAKDLLASFPELKKKYTAPYFEYQVRDKTFKVELYTESLSGTKLAKVALPKFKNPGDLLRWLMLENVPGEFPFTGGVFPFRRSDELAARMFAGEGDPYRTNKRFKFLSEGSDAKRLSTAFDSVTLYGNDPAERLDIYGKVGTSGVSICSVEDMGILYSGFDLCSPNTSVSMTINGPAPIILAFFLNTAINQQVDKFTAQEGRAPKADELAELKADALRSVRGTVQADILKEDQGQNTCIFAIDFALKMMADIQEWFIDNEIRNFYSVSISGYHIAEAGANPISQLAFTLANGFTFVEYYLGRGMDIDDFAPNLSFFFSLGMDPEYAVLNRVARRIWAITLRDKYGANIRSQKFKAHIQTSGRSLHAQEIQFNDIRTTLEALTALYDNCNSLHTNAYDEAVTTPTEESVRRALAIQLIINKEYGIYKGENFTQGSFVMEELTALVEEAVLCEFERISTRGGVLGAMELGYQRAKIQEESLYYEERKVSGSYPIVGVNTYVNEALDVNAQLDELELMRATDEEKQSQLTRLATFKETNKDEAPAALKKLQEVARADGNIFAELMEASKVCSLGQITEALYVVGGEYRRNM